jgi:hypothetical protein
VVMLSERHVSRFHKRSQVDCCAGLAGTRCGVTSRAHT